MSALEQFINSAQCILTSFARTEPVALGRKIAFKDRLDYLEQCSLHGSISQSGVLLTDAFPYSLPWVQQWDFCSTLSALCYHKTLLVQEQHTIFMISPRMR